MPNGDRPGSIYEQEPPSLLEALGEILEPTYELPGLSSYTKFIGKARDILDAPITKRKEEFAKTAGIDVEDVSRADIGAGIPLSLMLGGTLAGHSNPLAAAARAMGDPRVTHGDLPSILAPASGDPETGLYSPLDATFAVAEIVPLAKLATRPIKRIAGKVLDDFSKVVQSAKMRRMEKQISRLQAESPGIISGADPLGPAPSPTLSPEIQAAYEQLGATHQASLVPDIADVPTKTVPDVPSPKKLPEGKVIKTTDEGTEYISSGIDEFDSLERKLQQEAMALDKSSIKGFTVIEDTKNFNPENIPLGEAVIIRTRKAEGRIPSGSKMREVDRDVVIMKTRSTGDPSSPVNERFYMRVVSPDYEKLPVSGKSRTPSMTQLDWSVSTGPTGTKTISGLAFFGRSPSRSLRMEAEEEIVKRLQKAGKISPEHTLPRYKQSVGRMDDPQPGDLPMSVNDIITAAIKERGEGKLRMFAGSASDDFIKFLPDNWKIQEDSLTFDSFMLILKSAVKHNAEIIFNSSVTQAVGGGSLSPWFKKTQHVLLDATGKFRRDGVDEVVEEAVKVLKKHKYPERIVAPAGEARGPGGEIFRKVIDPKDVAFRESTYAEAILDPRLMRKLEAQHGVERAREIAQEIQAAGAGGRKGPKTIEFGKMTIKQVKTVVASLMGLKSYKELNEFMNYNPGSMEAQVFDSEQMF